MRTLVCAICTGVLGCGMLLAAGLMPISAAATAKTTDTQGRMSQGHAVATILSQSKVASGGSAWDHIRSLRVEGTYTQGRLSGQVSTVANILNGQFVSHLQLDGHRFAQGFDGRSRWTKSPDGGAFSSDTPEDVRSSITAAYQRERAWWFPSRRPASIQTLGTQRIDGQAYEVLRITPQGGDPFELWINSETRLIARFVSHSATVPETTYFSDYRTVNGIKIPFRTLVSNGTDRGNDVTQLKTVAVNVPVSVTEFAIPTQHFTDFSFIDGGNTATLSSQLVDNHVDIPVAINGHPLHFLLDSGGRNLLTRKVAAAIGVKSNGALQATGVGEKHVSTGIARVRSFTLGGKVLLRDQTFFVMSLPGANEVLGAPFDGLTGPAIFKRFVVRIDYADRKLTLVRPGDFNPSAAGTAVPFTFSGEVPLIHGSIDGLKGLFTIDTGAQDALTLKAPFSAANSLYTRYRVTPPTVTGFGVGGMEKGQITRGGTLMIGKVPVYGPVVSLAEARKGAGADKHIAGNIGNAILKRFTVTFDYATQTMYLAPNRNYREPMNYDRSGMVVAAHGKDFVVMATMSGGPARQAGLKAGDIISAVDEKPASAVGLNPFRELLRTEPPGTHVMLRIGEGRAAQTVTITLRRLVPEVGGFKKAA